MSTPSPRSSRGNPSMGDVVRTVVVLGALILAIWAAGQFFASTPDAPAQVDDYARIAADAREAAPYELLAPESLPEGWISNDARYDPPTSTWHLGVVTADGDYVGLEQLDDDVEKMVERFAPGAELDGEVTIDGTTWMTSDTADGETTLVQRGDGVTTLVTGDAPRDVIERYVASLSAS